MKKTIFLMAALLLLTVLAAGCGAQKTEEVQEKTLTGTLDEVKDFVFVVTDEENHLLCPAPIEESKKPEGLEDLSQGERVTVTYTGELSEVDPFTGEILSVEKAE